jgi:hypothetical protein
MGLGAGNDGFMQRNRILIIIMYKNNLCNYITTFNRIARNFIIDAMSVDKDFHFS